MGKVTRMQTRIVFLYGNDKDLWMEDILKAEIYSGVILILLTAINNAVNANRFLVVMN
jgi:hypothetical protein